MIRVSVLLLFTFYISACNARDNLLLFMKGCEEINSNYVCQSCTQGYTLDSQNQCIYSSDVCNTNSQEVCNIDGCLLQQNGKCLWCVAYQSIVDGICKWWSHKTKTFTFDLDSANLCPFQSADMLEKCEFCYFNKLECDQCNKEAVYFNGSCTNNCPNGSYQDANNKCQQCHPRCSSCSSYEQCDVCADSTTILSDDCACKAGMLYQGQCVEKCPYTFDEDKICVNKCYNPSQKEVYPIFAFNSQPGGAVNELPSFYCSMISQSHSTEYCDQNLRHLKDLINMTMTEESSPSLVHVLKVVFDETPHYCYTFKLFGKATYEVANTFLDSEYSNPSTNQRQTTLIFKIPFGDFNDDSLIETVGQDSQLHLKVFWNGQVHDTLDISIKQDVYGQLSTSKDYQSTSSTTESVACTQCGIQVSKIIDSKLDMSCEAGETCNQDLITAKSNTWIKFSQIITDPLYEDSTLLPQSIRLDYTTAANNTNQTIYFSNYQYDNSVTGQISYTISTLGVQSGNLTVTSYIKKTRLLALDSDFEREISEIKYPQMKVYLEIRQPFYEQLKSWMFYGMIIVIIFFIFRKQNKTTTTTKEQYEIRNYEQIPKSVEIQMEE